MTTISDHHLQASGHSDIQNHVVFHILFSNVISLGHFRV